MSGMLTSVEQKKIYQLLGEKDSLFLIPDYQRPYAWGEDECSALWNDVLEFASLDSTFNTNDEYFLGPIVTFSNQDGKFEVIDGQQRLITILLLLRAFYQDMENFSDAWSLEVRKNIGRCIWITDEQGKPFSDRLKIESQVATDDESKELTDILESGLAEKEKSKYAVNYRLFQEQIRALSEGKDKSNTEFQNYYSKLPNRLICNCILLPIQANSQDAALRIFSTLNDRGKPLSDSDIFKVKLYKAFSDEKQKDFFVEEWKNLEILCARIFVSEKIPNPMDELFTRYMHFERSKAGIKDSTQEGLRSFYEKNNYSLLTLEHKRVFANLMSLAEFWRGVADQDEDKFSPRVLKRLFVLNHAPNSAWTLITSVYFMQNRQIDGKLDDEKFYGFLGKIIAFIWAYTVTNSGVGRLRTPLYGEMINIVNDREVSFTEYKFDADILRKKFLEHRFSGKTKITRSMLAWWLMNDREQSYLPLAPGFETEHLRKKGKINPELYEMLGNKTLIEGKIKASTANLDFAEKRRYFTGITIIRKAGTKIRELTEISAKNNFNAKDISQRNKRIIDSFIQFITENGLTK